MTGEDHPRYATKQGIVILGEDTFNTTLLLGQRGPVPGMRFHSEASDMESEQRSSTEHLQARPNLYVASVAGRGIALDLDRSLVMEIEPLAVDVLRSASDPSGQPRDRLVSCAATSPETGSGVTLVDDLIAAGLLITADPSY